MSASAPSAPSSARDATAEKSLQTLWQERIKAGKSDRARYEPTWHQNLAFAAGKHWLQWSRVDRRLRLPKLPEGRLRLTVEVLNQYRMTALGELSADDFRPELLFSRDDTISEDYAEQANSALGYGWDEEWRGDEVMLDLLQKLIDLGTGYIQCQFDPTAGPVIVEGVPHQDGEPLFDAEKARAYVADQHATGGSANVKPIHEGRIRWKVGGPFGLIVPAGVEHERDFPWEITVGPQTADSLVEEFGAVAEGIKADTLSGVNQLGVNELLDQSAPDPEGDSGSPGKLANHVLVYRCFERPTRKFPNGRTTVLAGSDMRVLRNRNQLPYKAPDGTPRSGISYFHYWRVTGRFWGKALIENGIGHQKALNKLASQRAEIVDRGLPKVFVEEGSLRNKPTGLPLEVIEIESGKAKPQTDGGIGPGSWMFEMEKVILDELDKAMGIRAVSLGENPTGVGNYSQLALLRENDQIKTNPIITRLKLAITHVVEDSVYDIRRYWGSEKQIAIAGDDKMVDAQVFDATKIPTFYMVRVAKGASQPRSQAAQLKKIDDLVTYSINSGQPLPLDWLARSYEEGKPVELPSQDTNAQLDKAMLENALLSQGGMPQVAYYDDHALHVQVVRGLQAQADTAQDAELSARCEQHAQAHLQQAEQNAAVTAAGGTPGQPPANGAAVGQAGPAGAPAGFPNAYSLFHGSTSNGRNNFGI